MTSTKAVMAMAAVQGDGFLIREITTTGINAYL
jgi:hypothetical protein